MECSFRERFLLRIIPKNTCQAMTKNVFHSIFYVCHGMPGMRDYLKPETHNIFYYFANIGSQGHLLHFKRQHAGWLFLAHYLITMVPACPNQPTRWRNTGGIALIHPPTPRSLRENTAFFFYQFLHSIFRLSTASCIYLNSCGWII